MKAAPTQLFSALFSQAQSLLPLCNAGGRRCKPECVAFVPSLLSASCSFASEVITSGFRMLPLPYFPSPAGVVQSMINDRGLLFDSTWHSLVLLLSGYLLGVVAG